MSQNRLLLLCSAPVVDGALIAAFVEHASVRLEDATVVSSSGSLLKDELPQSTFATAVSVASASGQHTAGLLRVLLAALCPGGQLVVQEPQVISLHTHLALLCRLDSLHT